MISLAMEKQHRGKGKEEPGREFRWIDWIRGRRVGTASRVLVGIGDDAAVWAPRRGQGVVLTVDVQAEGVHFRREWMSLREIGARAVSVSVSDLAALGARPACLLVSILAGGDSPGRGKGDAKGRRRNAFSDRDFRELYRGIETAARLYGSAIAGGNLSEGPLSITVVAIGEGPPGRLVLRSGAREGDEIWVTGAPGLARVGLELLRKGPRARVPSAARSALRAFTAPRARIEEAPRIVRSWRPTAMVDLSDGLSADLGHILQESTRRAGRDLGAEIDMGAILGLPGLRRAALAVGCDPLQAALSGGDDYELAFTAPPSRRARGRRRPRTILGTPVTRIGRIVGEPGIRIRELGGKLRPASARGWAHFDRR